MNLKTPWQGMIFADGLKMRRLPLFCCCLVAGFTVGLDQGAKAGDSEPLLEVVEIADNIFVAPGEIALANPANQGHIANLSFVIGEKSVAVIDTGGSFNVGARLLATIRSKTDLPISHVINTHVHPDHMFGNAAFEDAGASFVAHQKFNDSLARRGPHYLAANLELIGKKGFSGTGLLPATEKVEKEQVIDLGGRRLRLIAEPTAHTDNDLIVIDEQTATAFLGDLLFIEHIPTLDGNLHGWLSVIEKLSQIEFARVVPGHGPAAVGWPAAIRPQQRYLEVLRDELRAHIAAGLSINEASKRAGLSEKNAWALFEAFNTRNATAAFAELEWE